MANFGLHLQVQTCISFRPVTGSGLVFILSNACGNKEANARRFDNYCSTKAANARRFDNVRLNKAANDRRLDMGHSCMLQRQEGGSGGAHNAADELHRGAAEGLQGHGPGAHLCGTQLQKHGAR